MSLIQTRSTPKNENLMFGQIWRNWAQKPSATHFAYIIIDDGYRDLTTDYKNDDKSFDIIDYNNYREFSIFIIDGDDGDRTL